MKHSHADLLTELKTHTSAGPAVWPEYKAQDILREASATGEVSDKLRAEVNEARIAAHMRMAETRLRAAEINPRGVAGSYLAEGTPLKDNVLAHFRLAGDIQPDAEFLARLDKTQNKLKVIVSLSELRRFEAGQANITDPKGIVLHQNKLRNRLRDAGAKVTIKGKLERRIMDAGKKAELAGLKSRLARYGNIPRIEDQPNARLYMIGQLEPGKSVFCIVHEMEEMVRKHGVAAELLIETRKVGREMLLAHGVRLKRPDTPADIIPFSRPPAAQPI